MLRDTYKKNLRIYADCVERLKNARKKYAEAVKECNALMPHLHDTMPPRMMNYSELRKIQAKNCREAKLRVKNSQRMCEIYHKWLMDFHFGA